MVLSFLAALLLSQLAVRRLGDQLVDIGVNAAPSIAHVSAARAELSRLGLETDEYVSTGHA